MVVLLTPGQIAAHKAWETRRNAVPVVRQFTANGKPVAAGPVAAPAAPASDLIMLLSIGQQDGLAMVRAGFAYAGSDTGLSADQMALPSVYLESIRTSEADATMVGHDTVVLHMTGIKVDTAQAAVTMGNRLNAMLATGRMDSEDSSLPMALQAMAWGMRADWIEYEGKRTKRSGIYALAESMLESINGLYAADHAKAV